MQYENNVRKKKFTEKKTNKIWFSKSLFPKGTSGKTGVVLYSGQYGNNKVIHLATNVEAKWQKKKKYVYLPLSVFIQSVKFQVSSFICHIHDYTETV